MSAPRKRWDEHSDRWKREKTREGLSKSRWDNWFKLSSKSRKVADPYKYAKGESVRSQIRTPLEHSVVAHMVMTFPRTRMATVRLGVKEMTPAQMKWTVQANAAQIAQKARAKYTSGRRNPWWYN